MCIELYIDKILVFSQCDNLTQNESFAQYDLDSVNESIQYYNTTNISTHLATNISNTTLNTTNITRMFNFTFLTNTSSNLLNLSMEDTSMFSPTMSPPNLSINTSAHLPYNTPSPPKQMVDQETIGEVLMQIAIPLFILGGLWLTLLMCRRKQKVQNIKMIDNPCFGADVETPVKNSVNNYMEHKDPDVKSTDQKDNVPVEDHTEHKDS